MSTNQEQIEQKIHEVLAADLDAISLSNRLFSSDGLFCQLAETEQERRLVARTPLFQQAQKRLSELQRKEGAAFTQAVQQAHGTLPPGVFWLKLEQRASSK